MSTPSPSVLVAFERFVNRDKELQYVKEKIEQLRRGMSPIEVIINFYGVYGIGKTSLLLELARLATTKLGQEKYALQVPYSHVDFRENVRYANAREGGPALLRDIIRNLNTARVDSIEVKRASNIVNKAIGEYEQWLKDGPEPDMNVMVWEDKINYIADLFVDYVGKLTKATGAPALFLFDTLEQVNGGLLDWLEYAVFAELIDIGRVLLIFAGRTEVKWKTFPMRRATTRAYKLRSFDEEGTSEQMAGTSYEEVAPNVYSLTFGHPLANRRMVERLSREQSVDKNVIERLKPELLDSTIQDFLEESTFRDLSTDVACTVPIISVLRLFELSSLQRMLTRFGPDYLRNQRAHFYLALVGQMMASSLVEYNRERKGYAITSDALRHMLALNMNLNDKSQFIEANEEAIAFYQELIVKQSEYRGINIQEEIFHHAALGVARGEDDRSIGNRLLKRLDEYLRNYYRKEKDGAVVYDVGRLDRLWHEFKEDKELANMIPAGHEMLIKSIKGRMR